MIKQKISLIIFFCFLALLGRVHLLQGQQKYALIVTISNYEEGSGWTDLHAYNDVELIKYALLEQGFEEDQIKVLQDEEATKAGIMDAFRTHLLDQVEAGDVAFFHFSGHGQQTTDIEQDELDGYDEAIVPYDSPLRFERGVYQGERLIRDDELGRLCNELRMKLGSAGNLWILLDACHSGTGTRSLDEKRQVARGTDVIMADSAYIFEMAEKETEANFLNYKSEEEENMANMVSFFAASANERNYEATNLDGERMGSLSYAFGEVFAKARKEDSYQTVFDRIKLKMGNIVPGQQPQAEGELNQQILGGRIIGKRDYFRLTKSGWYDELDVELDAGNLKGVFEGAKLGFFPPDTEDFDNTEPTTIGYVTSATLKKADVELQSPLAKEEALLSRVIILERTFGDKELKLGIDLPEDDPVVEELNDRFSEYPFIRVVKESADLWLSADKIGSEEQLMLTTADGNPLYKRERGTRSAIFHSTKLLKAMCTYIQCAYLKKLEMEEESMQLDLQFIRVTTNEDGEEVEEVWENKPLVAGDRFRLRVINNGDAGVYYSVIDIQPDFKLAILFPEKKSKRTIKEYFLEPGASYKPSNVFKISPPFGTEVIKLVATTEPIDLRSILSTRGAEDDTPHPFEQLFASTYLFENRGSGPSIGLTPEVAIYTKIVEIVGSE